MNTQTMTASYSRGFTLVELLSVLAIFGILLVIAIPSGQHFLIQNRTTAHINTLTMALHYARNESVSRNERLTFCKSRDHKQCGGRWRDGQILLDTNKNVLRVFSAIPEKDNLVWNSSGGLDDFIVWLPTGYTNGQRGTFYYCAGNNNTNSSRKVVLLDTGRSYTSAMDAGEYAKYCILG
jgi:type IV fimbrial biogenesis protein FimT